LPSTTTRSPPRPPLEREIKQTIKKIRRDWVELAFYLHEFVRIDGWVALGYETAEEWLADPQIELSRSQAYRLAEAYREFCAYRGVAPDRLGRVDLSKLQLTTPAVRRGQVDPQRAIADAEVLSWRDLRERYGSVSFGDDVDGKPIEPDEFVWEVCTGCDHCAGCGSRYKRRVQPWGECPDCRAADRIDLENPGGGEHWQERAAGRYYGYPECCIEAFVADLRWGEQLRWSRPLGERRERTLFRPDGHIMCDACRDDPARADRLAAEAGQRRIAPVPEPRP
jgi:hypothetical protein